MFFHPPPQFFKGNSQSVRSCLQIKLGASESFDQMDTLHFIECFLCPACKYSIGFDLDRQDSPFVMHVLACEAHCYSGLPFGYSVAGAVGSSGDWCWGSFFQLSVYFVIS